MVKLRPDDGFYRVVDGFIQENTTCFFDGGTTIFALAEALYRDPVAGLRVAEMPGRCAEVDRETGVFLTP